jgi:hypothetical protein
MRLAGQCDGILLQDSGNQGWAAPSIDWSIEIIPKGSGNTTNAEKRASVPNIVYDMFFSEVCLQKSVPISINNHLSKPP